MCSNLHHHPHRHYNRNHNHNHHHSRLYSATSYCVSPLMSRLLDSLVEAISACKPFSDAFSFRSLVLKVASIVDTGYMEAVIMRATLLNDKGSKQMQTDAQALLDSFRALKSSNLPLTAAAVKLLALDLVSRVLQSVACDA